MACVARVYATLAAIEIAEGHFLLREKLAGMCLEALQAPTGAPLQLDGPLADLTAPEV